MRSQSHEPAAALALKTTPPQLCAQHFRADVTPQQWSRCYFLSSPSLPAVAVRVHGASIFRLSMKTASAPVSEGVGGIWDDSGGFSVR